MTSPEGEAFYFLAERKNRTNGLIGSREGFEFPLPDQSVLEQFEYKWLRFGRQPLHINGSRYRLDHYFENGNETYSVVQLLNKNHDGTQNCIATSYIIFQDGTSLLETHPSVEQDGEVIWEPPVGDDLIRPAETDGYLLFCHVAFDSELQETA